MKAVVGCVALAIAGVLVPLAAQGKIKQADLSRQTVVTEQAALLNQVDTVSLYLTSPKVSYAPRLSPQGIIEVEVTVLDPALIRDRAKLEDFVSRQVRTFTSVLMERLPIYAPAVAAHFNPQTDMTFFVNAGANRQRVATVSGNAWVWWKEGASAAVPPPAAASAPTPMPAKASAIPPPAPAAGKGKQAPAPVPASKEASAAEGGKKGCGCPVRR
jgi:hypothetical protein